MRSKAHGELAQVTHASFRLEAVHALLQSPALRALMQVFLDGPLFLHPRPFTRIIPPVEPGHPDTTTAAHQDYVSQQGTERTLTAWIPLHDLDLEDGVLTVASGSHLNGV